MIVSFKNNFIFVKTRKVAGTSVEILLSAHCGKDDVVTSITPQDERLKLRIGGRIATNDLHNRSQERLYALAVRMRLLKLAGLVRDHARRKFKQHEPISRIIELVGPEFCDRAFKFTIERHPYDKVLSSMYFHLSNFERRNADIRIEDSLRRLDQRIDADQLRKSSDWHRYTVGGRVAVDRVLRYENLQQDLDDVLAHLGLGGTLALPSAKSGLKSKAIDPHEVLTARHKRAIQDAFANEFEFFGYEV